MDAITGFYETQDITTLVRDFLSFPKFDKSIIAVKNAKGLRDSHGIIDRELSALYYIKPCKATTVDESIMFITTLFNENTPIDLGTERISIKEFMLRRQ